VLFRSVGILLTFPAAAAFGKSMGMFFPIFYIEPETIYLDIALSLVVGLLAGIVPTLHTLKVRIADGLRMIE
jgi:putative ABC transport system permease protein